MLGDSNFRGPDLSEVTSSALARLSMGPLGDSSCVQCWSCPALSHKTRDGSSESAESSSSHPTTKGSKAWYQERLGLQDVPGQGVTLKWRAHERPEKEHLTTWSTFPETSKYFDHSTAPFMINYIVDDLDAILGKLKKQGV